ncbi:MAG: hypothetical protein EOP06_13375 [Proteobacteria bacterium]|nr:MAG: hypothetical protein EOP06_13375 [Pseudomonadota bacterium]
MILLAETSLTTDEIELEKMDPAFRRATRNMALATLVTEKVLESLPVHVQKDEISFVVGTHFGEIDSTLEFLHGCYELNTARPILFQNSLHNSTLGFVSMRLGLTGPAMTVSCDRDTASASVNLGETLLELTPYVLVCTVDCLPKALKAEYLRAYPFIESYVDRAHCALYARSDRTVTDEV